MEYGALPKQFKLFGIPTSGKELFDLAKAWFLISVAFSFIFKTPENAWLFSFVAAFLTVGSAFLIHELAHKLAAQRYRCWAEFRSFDLMLAFAMLTALIGFVFAAPGAVMIRGNIKPDVNGRISIAGPGANILLAIMLGISYILLWEYGAIGRVVLYGFLVNSWLALLNLLPIPSFDGRKVLDWNKPYYFFALALSFSLLVISYSLLSF